MARDRFAVAAMQTALVPGLIALFLGSGGMWFQSEDHRTLAMEQFHKIEKKVHHLEAVAKNAAVNVAIKAHLMKDDGAHGPIGGEGEHHASVGGERRLLNIFIAVDVLLALIGIAVWFVFIRKPTPPVVVSGAGDFQFKIFKVTNLPNLDSFYAGSKDLTDAYVEVNVRGNKKTTPTIKDNLNPAWDAKSGTLGKFRVDFDDKKKIYPEPAVSVSVYDYDGVFQASQLVGDLKFDTKTLVADILTKNRGKLPPYEPFHLVEKLTMHLQAKDPKDPKDPKNPHPPPAPQIELEVSWEPFRPYVK